MSPLHKLALLLASFLLAITAPQEVAPVESPAPGEVESYHNKGLAHYRAGQYKEAAEAFRQAIRLKSDYALAYRNLGFVYDKLGRHGEAVEVYRQAIRLQPNHAGAYYYLGVAYFNSGRSTEASSR